MRGWSLVVLLALVLPVYPGSATHAPPSTPEASPWVVVAVVDSGINPYHADFRASGYPDAAANFSRHPSTYISGFPADATRLDLTLGAASYSAAKAADGAKWASLQKNKLYWIPGTKIIAARDMGDDGFANVADPTPILDDFHHGTSVASLAVGNTRGLCPRCLLVVVEDPAGIEWALGQAWIDIVVNSWGEAANLGVPNPEPRLGGFDLHFATREAAECGQTVLFASGNGLETFTIPEQTYFSNSLGPGWVLRIGGYLSNSAGERIPMWGTGKPVDVVAQGVGAVTARHDSFTRTRNFTGTSAAAPIAGGVFADTLLRARLALGDISEGIACEGQVLASGPAVAGASPGAALADGTLTRAELWDAVLRSATPTQFTGIFVFPLGVNAELLAPANEGFGALDSTSAASAYSALLSGAPARPDASAFMAQDASLREALWGTWDKDGDGDADASSPAMAAFWSAPIP